ncbi:helix-turn-helix domain-containing protein [Salmonella enterica]|nr:helix-turn-helix domain-containing protein [Salmonella enterica]
MLNSKAQLTVDVIAKVTERKITIGNAAKLLNKSRRTIERYLQRYREPIKASMEDTDVQKKLDVLALADKLGNVAEASRLSGVSRDTIYRHRRLLKEGGNNALKRQETPNLRHKNCTELSIENTVVQFSIEHPHLGQQKVALKVKAKYGMDISPGGVRSIWLRQNLNTTALRIARAKSIQQTA